ncbi:MAG: hypothetical protein WB622_00290 [Acidobacteriaceae bacterium]
MIRASRIRSNWLVSTLLLAFCGMAAAQAAPASTPPPVAPRQLPAPSHLPAAETGRTPPLVSAAALSPYQQRLLDEADQLLSFAQELKAEVDKTNQYTLSINTLRRAEDIEKVAKNLQKEIEREDR